METYSSDCLHQGCENCCGFGSSNMQLRDFSIQYHELAAANNQLRRDLDAQVQRTKSIESALKMEMDVRVKAESQGHILQHIAHITEVSRKDADKRQTMILARRSDLVCTLGGI